MEIFKSIAESLHIDPTVALAQLVAFVILLAFLVFYLYRPMEAILQQRKEQIAKHLANADQERVRAEALRKEYEAHLAGIADEARAKLDQAMKDAEAARQRLLRRPHREIPRDAYTAGSPTRAGTRAIAP